MTAVTMTRTTRIHSRVRLDCSCMAFPPCCRFAGNYNDLQAVLAIPHRHLIHMSKAFTRETDGGDDDLPEAPVPVPGGKNYMTPAGHARMKSELKKLVEVERPETVRVVSWAASNGDRSENGDYIYGKRRLRELDHRIRYLIKRLEAAEVVDPRDRAGDQVFFGATVTYAGPE